MKRYALVVLVAAFAVFPTFGISTASNEGLVFLDGLGLYKDSGKAAAPLDYVEALTIGDKVTMLNRTSKFKVNNVERDYTRVRAPDGKEGWALSPYIATRAYLGVVSESQALVYSEPRDVKVTAKYVSALTVVAVSMDGSAGGFVEVQCYDPVQKAYFLDNAYLSQSDVTTSDSDVNAAILYTVASDSKDPNIKKRLLTLASTKYPDSVFINPIRAALGLPTATKEAASAPAAAAPAAPKEAMEASGSYRVTKDGVRIRKAPDEVNGAVIGSLKTDDVVYVFEVTTESYTIGSDTAPWFHIDNPDGWVFGAFLTPED